jgi:endonuclease YncB( thermonuclease family)
MEPVVDLEKARRERDRKKRPSRPPGRMRAILIRILIGVAVIAALAVAANWRSIWSAASSDDGLVGLYVPAGPLRATMDAAAPAPAVKVAARRFPICGARARTDCVVDGDTLWLAGTKIRIADINTPELSSPACAAERRLGERATLRLQSLLEAGPFELRAQGRDADRYGRKLRILVRNGRSLGEVLVAEGLAHPWNGGRESWCG